MLSPHRVLSNSAHVGGQREALRFLVNHQSCEATGDRERHELIAAAGQIAYHHTVCGELGLDPDDTAVLGTAANMAYAAHCTARFDDLRVDAFTTAGVAGNAARAGDPAAWCETDEGWRRVAPPPGTINTILLLDCPVTPAAQGPPRRRDDDRGQIGRAGGSGRAQPLFADHCHGYRHGPVLSGGSARPHASREGVDQSPT